MDEILELRQCIEQGRYADALHIIDEMDEMAKKDILNKIRSYTVVLLIHLIKKYAEQRLTRSWRNSIKYAVAEIRHLNARSSSSGVYAPEDMLREIISERFEFAFDKASEEISGGVDAPETIAARINAGAIQEEALRLMLNGFSDDPNFEIV
jgi:Domain of unknown function DUF29